jgi:metal-responsive CopG/Arc/MetJ family transcriptional regulator
MKMVRKTVSLDDELYRELENEGVLAHFKNFSDLVSSSLKQTIDEIKKQNYTRQIAEMANDPLVQEDIAQVQEDFKYADGEIDAF